MGALKAQTLSPPDICLPVSKESCLVGWFSISYIAQKVMGRGFLPKLGYHVLRATNAWSQFPSS